MASGVLEALTWPAALVGIALVFVIRPLSGLLAEMNCNLPMIGKLLGHADVRTTTRYAHLDDGHVIEAAQRIGDQIEQKHERLIFIEP